MWLDTARHWIPAGHLVAQNLGYPSSNWLPHSTPITGFILAQR